MNAFSLKEIVALGWPVLSVLSICSIVALAVILERMMHFGKREVDVNDFFSKIGSIVSSGREGRSRCALLGEPMATITYTALESTDQSRDTLDLVVDRAVRIEVANNERFVPILGTIASAAPFIGLLGTVIGIIKAFRSISITGGGGPQVVAGGIAEALIATALGLTVAIPSLIFYNYYSTKIRNITEKMEICADEIIELLTRKI